MQLESEVACAPASGQCLIRPQHCQPLSHHAQIPVQTVYHHWSLPFLWSSWDLLFSARSTLQGFQISSQLTRLSGAESDQ